VFLDLDGFEGLFLLDLGGRVEVGLAEAFLAFVRGGFRDAFRRRPAARFSARSISLLWRRS